MNILMVTTFYPPHIGGIEYHVENLSKNLVRRGHKITVLTSMLPKTELPYWDKTSDNVVIVRLKTIFPSGKIYSSLSSQGFTLNAQSTIKRLVKENQIDIIHAHGHHYYLTWRAIDIAKKLKVTSVLTLHGLYALNPADAIAQIEEEIFNHTIFRHELNQVTAIVGLTPMITNYARKYGSSSKKYFTIPNGVNHGIFTAGKKNRFDYRHEHDIDNDKIVVLFRGRFASIKGVHILAEAAKLVVKENSQVLFLFVGGGPLSKELAKILFPIKANSKIIDWTPVNKIHELYLASDIFVLPSKSEALPLTILEAMAAKLHIVATPVGGIPEVLKKYPYKSFICQLTASSVCMSIIDAIKKITQKSTLTCDSISAYTKQFDWQRITSEIEELYQEVVGNSKRTRPKDFDIQIKNELNNIQVDLCSK